MAGKNKIISKKFKIIRTVAYIPKEAIGITSLKEIAKNAAEVVD